MKYWERKGQDFSNLLSNRSEKYAYESSTRYMETLPKYYHVTFYKFEIISKLGYKIKNKCVAQLTRAE